MITFGKPFGGDEEVASESDLWLFVYLLRTTEFVVEWMRDGKKNYNLSSLEWLSEITPKRKLLAVNNQLFERINCHLFLKRSYNGTRDTF